MLNRRKPALVISDIVMPELDGYGLCKAIKADEKLRDIPVMLVTTLSNPRDVIRGLPPALEAPGAMEGACTCRRRLISGELDRVTNITECERLGKVGGDTRGLRYHASVPR